MVIFNLCCEKKSFPFKELFNLKNKQRNSSTKEKKNDSYLRKTFLRGLI